MVKKPLGVFDLYSSPKFYLYGLSKRERKSEKCVRVQCMNWITGHLALIFSKQRVNNLLPPVELTGLNVGYAFYKAIRLENRPKRLTQCTSKLSSLMVLSYIFLMAVFGTE